MEDLTTYKDYRKQLIQGECCTAAIEKIVRDIGQVHNQTHVAKIGEEKFAEYKSRFP
jgi:5-methylthioribose kinase